MKNNNFQPDKMVEHKLRKEWVLVLETYENNIVKC